jgi:hypothetical protein
MWRTKRGNSSATACVMKQRQQQQQQVCISNRLSTAQSSTQVNSRDAQMG